MNVLPSLYKHSLALLTDLYQLTMSYGYWKSGAKDKEAVFHLFFRENPFGGGFSVACGLGLAIEFVREFRFAEEDVQYLAGLNGNNGGPLFENAFLDYLRELKLSCDVDAIPEGTVVFPHEPLVRVQGSLLQCQLLETPLLNLVNFQTLVATKAARVCLAAKGQPVLEFGLRRAQGVDGGISASRAAYIGGCAGTSNVLAGKLHGIPVRGTHAHSWVMSFDDELEAFEAYARAMPSNCVFLVDTYDTLEGVRNAVKVGRWLQGRGHELLGIRLDSGDLGPLSKEARKILDEAGFPKAVIVASSELDEYRIRKLNEEGASIGVWGVGTRLATAYDQPALGGVYKLAVIREKGGQWQDRVKLSEDASKMSHPGILQVRRYEKAGKPVSDVLFDVRLGMPENAAMVNPHSRSEQRVPADASCADLLVPVFRAGRQVYREPELAEIRQRAQDQLARLAEGVKRLEHPEVYAVGLEDGLHQLETRLVENAKRNLRVPSPTATLGPR